MITYQEKKPILDKINPFAEWKLLDRKLTIWKESKMRSYKSRATTYKIDFNQLERGDSFWLPCSLLKKIRATGNRKALVLSMIPGDVNTKVIYYKEKGVWGYRVFCLKPFDLDVNKPKILKIAV